VEYKRILVLGAAGMLGQDLMEHLRGQLQNGGEVFAADLEQFDITDRKAAQAWVADLGPDLVINCAAYTNVDGAEENREAALAVNRDGAGHAAEAAVLAGADFYHISTDFIFDGTKDGLYLEDDEPNPLSVYGATKWEGEVAVRRLHPSPVIVRISWLFGHRGKNFVQTMLNLGQTRDELTVVHDEVGRPTYTRDLCQWLWSMMEARPAGETFHAANSGRCSWFEFALRIIEEGGLAKRVTVRPTTAAEWGAPAPRPPCSVLSLDKLTALIGYPPRPWEEALKDYVGFSEK
jgi:dTDP-4-dehydrorhamnose reductase